MTILYTCSTVGTFFLNRSWTFGHGGPMRRSLWRYAAVYAFGYVENLAALYVLVDLAGLPHPIVQAVLIFAVAVTIFLLQRFWVFPDSAARAGGGEPTAVRRRVPVASTVFDPHAQLGKPAARCVAAADRAEKGILRHLSRCQRRK
jgi:hypothetical protein